MISDIGIFLKIITFAGMKKNILNYDLGMVLRYLKRMHGYFLDMQFPRLREILSDHFLTGEHTSHERKVCELILRYYDNYVDEVSKHMQYEERTMFGDIAKDVEASIEGRMSLHHEEIENRFFELTRIIRLYHSDCESLIEQLSCIEEDLLIHCLVEDKILAPLVNSNSAPQAGVQQMEFHNQQSTEKEMPLSVREQEVARCVAQGLSNKEIADKLFISLNTVTTHRKNIARKLQIHSPAGLTIYCIANKLI